MVRIAGRSHEEAVVAGSCTEVDHAVQPVQEVGREHHRAWAVLLLEDSGRLPGYQTGPPRERGRRQVHRRH
jgi:hypothetical protein